MLYCYSQRQPKLTVREIQKIKYPAVFIIGYAKRLLVLMPSLSGWATAGYFITAKCLTLFHHSLQMKKKNRCYARLSGKSDDFSHNVRK
jgi:hypothetical protein